MLNTFKVSKKHGLTSIKLLGVSHLHANTVYKFSEFGLRAKMYLQGLLRFFVEVCCCLYIH